MTFKPAFSPPDVHHLRYADDFCDVAHEIRAELLGHPTWIEMSQDSAYGPADVRFDRQTGITTGHLDEAHRHVLRHALAFKDLLAVHAADLCAAAGVPVESPMEIEMNGMAYGEGGWLSPHTDYDEHDPQPRRLAWMLYLTHPDDGEWAPHKGGAVRLFDARGGEARVRPRFNRFAMFRVSEESRHEIEAVAWSCGWDRCRLALSGWILGPEDSTSRRARLYVRRPDAAHVRSEAQTRLRGALAMYRIMREQRVYNGQDASDTDAQLRRLEGESEAHAAAPDGTAFLRHVPGPSRCIFIVDERGQVVYFGPPEDYRTG